MKNKKLKIQLKNAIDAGKDRYGNAIQIPVFESIVEIDGELYGVIDRYVDPPSELNKENFIIH